MENNKNPEKDLEKKEDKKTSIYDEIENASVSMGVKKGIKINFIILIVLLLLIGVGSYFVMKESAIELAGAGKYKEMVSQISRKPSLIEKVKYVFSIPKKIVEASIKNNTEKNKTLEKNDSNTDTYSSGSASGSSGYSGAYSKSEDEMGNVNSNYYRPSSKLSSNLSSPSGFFSGSSNSKTTLSKFSEKLKDANVRVNKSEEAKNTNFSKRKIKAKDKNLAIESLNKAFKASLTATKDASADNARNWVATAFGENTSSPYSLDYGEKLRAKLDKINPKSIPSFLKNPDLEIDSIRSLKPADVSAPKIDEEETKKMNEDDELKKKMTEDMLSNMINPMFDGINPVKKDDGTENDTLNAASISSPDTEPQLKNNTPRVYTDEYGYIIWDDGNLKQIFDPNSGKLLGCESPAAGMCLMPGAEIPLDNGETVSCPPAETYFV